MTNSKASSQSPPSCLRCGKCCLADMASFSSLLGEGDIERWREQGRADILHILDEESAVWMGDHLVNSRDGRYIHGCPFLKTVQDHYACAIYDTRPEVCRNYLPGSSEICPLYKK